jgi:CheY-like chemotaxis protein
MSESKLRSADSGAAPTVRNKPGILLVEDDTGQAEAVARHLRTYGGFQVYHAKTVQQALSLARQYPTLRLVAMDMGLPEDETPTSYSDLSGIVLLRELDQIIPKAKIYIKSGLPITSQAKEFIEAYNKSVVRVRRGWEPTEIVEKAKIVYSDGQMQPSIFIVHGHDANALEQLIFLVRSDLKLGEPTVIKDEPESGRVIIEKFEEYAQRADLVFALLTPDDATDTARRARQNVVFEIGYFTAALGRKSGKVILLHHKGAEKPSDMDGLLTIDITQGVRKAAPRIRKELKGWWGTSAAVADRSR